MIVAITFALFILVAILVWIGVRRWCRKNKIADDPKVEGKYKPGDSNKSL